MKFDADTYYIWVGGSCDYSHKERAGGGAYITECKRETVDFYIISEFETTEFRMMLKVMIHAMEKFRDKPIVFLSNVQYLQNFDNMNSAVNSPNMDLIKKCAELKKSLLNVTVKQVPFHKFEQIKKAHELASDAMRKLRNSKI